jgi:hypothetical protein
MLINFGDPHWETYLRNLKKKSCMGVFLFLNSSMANILSLFLNGLSKEIPKLAWIFVVNTLLRIMFLPWR